MTRSLLAALLLAGLSAGFTVGCTKTADDAEATSESEAVEATSEDEAEGAEQAEAAPEEEVAPATSDVNPVSTEILAREPVTESASVQHVLISWDAQSAVYAPRGGQDERGAARDEGQANALAAVILERAATEDFASLMGEFSEDRGSAATGRAYTATPDAGLVQGFKDLSLRLNVDEVGVVKTLFGYHIIKRNQ